MGFWGHNDSLNLKEQEPMMERPSFYFYYYMYVYIYWLKLIFYKNRFACVLLGGPRNVCPSYSSQMLNNHM